MMAVDRYLKGEAGKGMKHSPPPIIIEIGLYDRFHWTPDQVDAIPYKKLQEIMVALNQMEASNTSLKQTVSTQGGKRQKGK